MKALVIADRPPRNSIKNTIAENGIDLVITLGDLDRYTLIELEDIHNIPKIGVYGNHCSGNYFESLGIEDMHLHTFDYKGLKFGGFEGCVRYKESSYGKMYTQEEASALIKQLPYVDVLLCHCPPYKINDEPNQVAHQGFKALREYVEQYKPQYLLHGHTYPKAYELVETFDETKIIYVHQDEIVNLSDLLT
jgi:uncharacterized protein